VKSLLNWVKVYIWRGTGLKWVNLYLLLTGAGAARAQVIPQIIYPDIVIEQRKSFAEMFKAGNTNCPLLDIGWFNKGGYFCIVGQSGFGGAAGVGGGLGVVISLNETNLILLKEAIDHLPPSSGDALPMERKIFFSGIQSNQWFQAIYDRNNVPVEFKHIEKIAGVGMP